MMDCLFCKIVKGDIPIDKIYEDKDVLVFLDINPVAKGHSLVIPKKHFRNILETPDKELSKIIAVIKKIGNATVKAMDADGINIHINNEKPAGQVIFHTHAHVIPRTSDDNLKMWKGTPQNNHMEMRKVAEKICDAVEKMK